MKKFFSLLALLVLFAQVIPPLDAFAAPAPSPSADDPIMQTWAINAKPDGAKGIDTYINSAGAYECSPNNAIFVGNRAWDNNKTARGLIRFDLSSIPAETAVIEEAYLTLWVFYSGDQANTANVQIYPATTPWVEDNASWTNSTTGGPWSCGGTGTPWTTPGGDYNSSLLLGEYTLDPHIAQGTMVVIPLSAEAIKSIADGGVNYGWMIKMEDEDNDFVGFYSSEEGGYPERRPQLYIKYQAPPPVDPGWICYQGSNIYRCPDPQGQVLKPFDIKAQKLDPFFYSMDVPITGANLACANRIECVNNYPIYWAVNADVVFYTDDPENHISTINARVHVRNSWGGEVDLKEFTCGTVGEGTCHIKAFGIIDPSNMSDVENPYGWPDLSLSIDVYDPNNSWPFWFYFDAYNVKLSITPPVEDCSANYMVLVSDGPYTIDPIVEAPVGEPTDEQMRPVTSGQIYQINVGGGPWQSDVSGEERYDTAVSWDGETWQTLKELADSALCVVHNDLQHLDRMTIYMVAPSETFYIRVNDTEGEFGDNISPVAMMEYTLGLGIEIGLPPCEAQFQYDPNEDWVASYSLNSTADSQQRIYGDMVVDDWYAIEVASGTWNEPDGQPRIDTEYAMTNAMPNAEGEFNYADLAEGGGDEVYCVSEDGKIAFVQASAINLYMRVNDQNSDFSDNTGHLGLNVYHTAFVRDTDPCEQTFTLHDRIGGDSVDAQAENGKIMAVSGGDVIQFGLEPGAWYAVETKSGPWFGLGANRDKSYKMAIKQGGDPWVNLLDWTGAKCVVETDAVGHVRAYFQVPADAAVEYKLRVDDTSNFSDNTGSMAWDLYQAINLDDDDSENGCDYTYDPENRERGGTINPRVESGGSIYGLQVDTFYYLQFSGSWAEQSGGTALYDFQMSEDSGDTWYDLPDSYPGVLCYIRTGNDLGIFFKTSSAADVGYKYRLRVGPSTSYSDNTGNPTYDLYLASPGDIINPWENCISGDTKTVINSLEWIPVKNEGGTYINGTSVTSQGNSQALQISETYAIEATNGPWYNQPGIMAVNQHYTAQISSDNGGTWYEFSDQDNPDIMCSYSDSVKRYWTVVFTVQAGQNWKVRVNDEEGQFRDNHGGLGYKLYAVSGEDIPPVDVTDGGFNQIVSDVCEDPIIIPTPPEIGLDILFEGYGYLGEWLNYARLSVQKYFAWCPRHTEMLQLAMELLKTVEPIATIMEMQTASEDIKQEVDSYNWDAGPDNTSIFDLKSSSQVNAMINKYILRKDGEAFNPWNGGKIVVFGDHSLPSYYYNCNTNFSDYLPSALRRGVCFASAYAQKTGMSFWIQISLDVGALLLIFKILFDSVAELVYMMTGVRPWTKWGATQLVERVADGGSVVQDEWWDPRNKVWRRR